MNKPVEGVVLVVVVVEGRYELGFGENIHINLKL
jgi:hypothetical protein